MKTEYTWIVFTEQPQTGKTKIFDIVNKEYQQTIGQIKWYSGWRRYCFFPKDDCVFEVDCLTDITSFLKGLMIEYKALKQQEQQNKI